MSLPRISKGGVLLATGALALGMLLNPAPAQAHNNGVALTPPMGWSSWNIFGCDIDQWKIMDIADAIVEGDCATPATSTSMWTTVGRPKNGFPTGTHLG